MRVLFAAGGAAVQELNWRYVLRDCGHTYAHAAFYRYRRVPTFGRGTIRRFHNNASAMKRLAARDFEDLLQVNSHSPRLFIHLIIL